MKFVKNNLIFIVLMLICLSVISCKEQKDTINYLPVGGEELFSFKGVAYIYNTVPEMPESIPEIMEVVIESFETVDG